MKKETGEKKKTVFLFSPIIVFGSSLVQNLIRYTKIRLNLFFRIFAFSNSFECSRDKTKFMHSDRRDKRERYLFFLSFYCSIFVPSLSLWRYLSIYNTLNIKILNEHFLYISLSASGMANIGNGIHVGDRLRLRRISSRFIFSSSANLTASFSKM